MENNMIPAIVRQSVIIKCKLQKSTLVGNYEYYYAAGLFSRLSGITLPSALPPAELRETLKQALVSYEPSDPRELHLKKVLEAYHPDEEQPKETEELFCMGVNEDHVWEEHI